MTDVEQKLAELGVGSVSEAIAELDHAADALQQGNIEPALPWDESIESALNRINADLEMLAVVND